MTCHAPTPTPPPAPARGRGQQAVDAMSLGPASLLQLLWLASPALPVGGFSYSEGLEAAIESGAVHDEASASSWLLDQLHLALGRSELPLLAQAIAAWAGSDAARVAALNEWALATRETSELRRQSEQMGRSMHEWLRQRAPGDARLATLAQLAPAPAWPIAFALAAAQSGAEPRDALLAFGFGWAENMVQAALKAMSLGQSGGQRILGALAAALPAVVDAALALPDAERQAFTPMLAILSEQPRVLGFVLRRQDCEHRREGLALGVGQRECGVDDRRQRGRQRAEDALPAGLAERHGLQRRLHHVLGPAEAERQQGVARLGTALR